MPPPVRNLPALRNVVLLVEDRCAGVGRVGEHREACDRRDSGDESGVRSSRAICRSGRNQDPVPAGRDYALPDRSWRALAARPSAQSPGNRRLSGMTGRLVLAATPMGDVGDASPRLRSALATADVVAAEDTRRTKSLASALEVTITGKIVSFYDQVEISRLPALVADVAEGKTVLLVTDAGMPSVSDPGYRLVAACVAGEPRRHVLARSVGGDDGAGTLRIARRAVLLRRVPAA